MTILITAALRRRWAHGKFSYYKIHIEMKTCNEKSILQPWIPNFNGVSALIAYLPSDCTKPIPFRFKTNQRSQPRSSSLLPPHNVAIIKDSENNCQTRREVIQLTTIFQTTDGNSHANLLRIAGSQRVIITRHISNYEWLLPATSSLPTGTQLPIFSMAAHWLC